MPLFKFENFIFDSTSHSLTHKGVKVAIRPKALKLLNLLIQNRQRIVSKAEIMSCVWGSNYARDHLLFQLVGELRKLPFKNEFVRTQPNEGYQWNVATKVINKQVFVPRLIAASLITAVVCLSILALPTLKQVDVSSSQAGQLPAYGALAKGIIALQSGNKNKAIDWFEFALAENPDSVETSVFLAETLYQQNRPEESSAHLLNVLGAVNLSAYNKVTATNLLSRIRERQGNFDDALQYAQTSSLTEVLGQCSADVVEQRIEMLESELGYALAVPSIQSNNVETKSDADVALSKSYVDHCQRLKSEAVETSSCQPLREQRVSMQLA